MLCQDRDALSVWPEEPASIQERSAATIFKDNVQYAIKVLVDVLVILVDVVLSPLRERLQKVLSDVFHDLLLGPTNFPIIQNGNIDKTKIVPRTTEKIASTPSMLVSKYEFTLSPKDHDFMSMACSFEKAADESRLPPEPIRPSPW